MLTFLLTSWWFYIPIIGVLLFLTRRNNQKIKQIKTTDKMKTQSEDSLSRKKKPRKQSAKITKVTNKLGLKGASGHIRRK